MTAMQVADSVPFVVWCYWRLEEAEKCPPPQYREEGFCSRRTRFLYRVRRRMRELWAVMSDRERQMADPRPFPQSPRPILGSNIDARLPRQPFFGTRLGIGFFWMNG